MTKDELIKVYSYCLALIDFIEGNSPKEMFLEELGKELGLGKWSNVIIEEAVGAQGELMRRYSMNEETRTAFADTLGKKDADVIISRMLIMQKDIDAYRQAFINMAGFLGGMFANGGSHCPALEDGAAGTKDTNDRITEMVEVCQSAMNKLHRFGAFRKKRYNIK